MGIDKKKLLNHLPNHFANILPKDVCDKVTKLWKVSLSFW